jgi:hypothetical protein
VCGTPSAPTRSVYGISLEVEPADRVPRCWIRWVKRRELGKSAYWATKLATGSNGLYNISGCSDWSGHVVCCPNFPKIIRVLSFVTRFCTSCFGFRVIQVQVRVFRVQCSGIGFYAHREWVRACGRRRRRGGRGRIGSGDLARTHLVESSR